MTRYDDDQDDACVDCACGRCERCRDLDPAPIGKRECCCGKAADVTIWQGGIRVR